MSTKRMTIRMTTSSAMDLLRIAEARDTSAEELISRWLAERIEAERGLVAESKRAQHVHKAATADQIDRMLSDIQEPQSAVTAGELACLTSWLMNRQRTV